MIPIHFKMILSIFSFLVLFRSSTQYVITFDTSEDSSSSSSSSEESDTNVLQKDILKLKPDQQQKLMKNFLIHLLTISNMQTNERTIEHQMLEDLTKIPNFENDAIAAVIKFREVIEKGRKNLDSIIEKRKSTFNSKEQEVVRHYEGIWMNIESKKYLEVKNALENIDNLLSHFTKRVKSTIGEQMKTLQGIQHIIIERKKKVDRDSQEIRQKVDAINEATNQGTTTPSPEKLNALFLFDEKDVKQIRHIYNEWMDKLLKLNIPQSKHILQQIEKSGMSLPLFCKFLAERYVIEKKAVKCDSNGDKIGKEVLLKTLSQPNYKKTEQIIDQMPPLSFETIANVVRRNFFKQS